MKSIKIAVIGGARPNFMKVTPLYREMKRRGFVFFMVNTGQHFSNDMSENFIEEFDIKFKYNLNPQRDNSVAQLADIMIGLEKVFLKEKPELLITVGDVDSSLAGALVAYKMNIKLAHIEAGLRSGNKKTSEDKNQILIDSMSHFLFTTSKYGVNNLKREGVRKNVFCVGNIMIDTIKMFLSEIDQKNEEFYFFSIHKPENVDNKKVFGGILDAMEAISAKKKIYWPIHPRTRKMAKYFGLMDRIKNIFETLPVLSYKESLCYQKNAKLILTDSGGIQDESSYLGIPCITLRNETDRPVTVTHGSNILGGKTKESILKVYKKQDFKNVKCKIPFWDGQTTKRIVDIIEKNFK